MIYDVGINNPETQGENEIERKAEITHPQVSVSISVSVLVNWMRLYIERYIQVVRECAVRVYWCHDRETLNCSIVLLLSDASGNLFQSCMARGKNEFLKVSNLQLYRIKVRVLVELFLVVRVFSLRYSSAGKHTFRS